MLEAFYTDQLKYGKDAPGSKSPAYLLKYNELLDSFRDFRIFYYRECEIAEKKSVVSLIAQKK